MVGSCRREPYISVVTSSDHSIVTDADDPVEQQATNQCSAFLPSRQIQRILQSFCLFVCWFVSKLRKDWDEIFRVSSYWACTKMVTNSIEGAKFAVNDSEKYNIAAEPSNSAQ